MNRQIYFVLNGLLNGEDGIYAKTCGVGEQQPDGWYWIEDGMDDGKGPYMSREEAQGSANKAPFRYTYTYVGKHWRPYKDEDEGSENLTVRVCKLGNQHYTLECEQYYSNFGICKLEITQHIDRALATFAAVLVADDNQEQQDCERHQSRNRV